jgi:hypothetical protein
LLKGVPMRSSNNRDSGHARLVSQASGLTLTTCSLAELAAAVCRVVAAIGYDAHERYGTRKVFLAAVPGALGGECAIHLARGDPYDVNFGGADNLRPGRGRRRQCLRCFCA